MTSSLLNYNATTVHDAAFYFQRRAYQLLADGVTWEGFCSPLKNCGKVWGVQTLYTVPHGKFVGPAYSIYVLEGHRGQGNLSRALEHMRDQRGGRKPTFITVKDCNVASALEKHCNVLVYGAHTELQEYKTIQKYYGSKKAKRSGVPYMNHIDEGLAILSQLNAPSIVSKIFMLHPLIQVDEALSEYGTALNSSTYDKEAVAGAWEYRNTANAFLPKHNSRGVTAKLSADPNVNMALVADKIQNNKDFQAYLNNSRFPTSWRNNLNDYFEKWYTALGIPKEVGEDLSCYVSVCKPRITQEIGL